MSASQKDSKEKGKTQTAINTNFGVLNYSGSYSPNFAQWREAGSNHILSTYGEISSVFETGDIFPTRQINFVRKEHFITIQSPPHHPKCLNF